MNMKVLLTKDHYIVCVCVCVCVFKFDAVPLFYFYSGCLRFWCQIQNDHCQDQCQGAYCLCFLLGVLQSLVHLELIFAWGCVCFSPLSLQCPVALACQILLVTVSWDPGTLAPRLPEPGSQGVSPGGQVQRLVHQPPGKAPFWEIQILQRVAEEEDEDSTNPLKSLERATVSLRASV